MHSRKHFKVRMDYRSDGLYVLVMHPAIRLSREQGPLAAGTVAAATERLVTQLQAELVDLRDIRVDMGLCSAGQFISVTHVPTGRSVSVSDTRDRPHAQEDLLDELVAQLWAEGQPEATPTDTP